MANPNIRVDVDGNTAKLRRQIDQVAKQPVTINLQATGGAAQPLGKISGEIQEIDKSLAAANARVIAFAASAGAIYAIQNAVTSLFNTFVNVEKQLSNINVLLNLTDQNLAKFGASLFDIAGNTAQSFDVVSEAATELSRQGLGVEETLKRTEAALILTRLSGLDAAASVSALTAAINSFGSSALEATEIVNKLANVDAAFAVSSADLANALSRVGSSASDAGISFDELIALVTTAQQVTARGGSVIGNSLKTIFTRLGREKVQEVLGGLGIQNTDEQGNAKTQIQLLQELATVYDSLSATQRNYVAEQVGGVFQINVLKAALGDLGKEYSIYDQALKASLGSTDEAIRRNEKLNETLSARGTKALANIQQAGVGIAGGLFEPAANNVLNISELLTGAINNVDPESIGAKIGGGIVSGIGNFIGGPGLALVTAALVKLFAEFSKYGAEAFKSLLGVNQASKEQAAIQQSVVKFLQNNANIYKSISSGQTSVTAGAQAYLNIIKQQTKELQNQNSIAAQITKTTASQIGVQNVGGKSFVTERGRKVKTAAGGYTPSEYGEATNISNRVGGANPATDKPVTLKNFSFGGGKKGPITAHTGEWAVPNFAGGDGTAIFNRDMKQKYGLPEGARKISASGYIPNFATEKKSIPGGVISGRQSSQVANANLDMHSAFSFDVISVGSKAGFEKQFDKQLNNLNSEDPKLAGTASKYFTRNGYSLSQVDQLKQNLLADKKRVPSLLVDNKDYVSKSSQLSGVKNSLLGKYFERFAANRLGLQIAQRQNARMDLLDKSGKPVAEVKFGRIDKDNLISKVIETKYQKTLKQNPPVFDNIKMPNNYKLVVPNAASGFVPNFAAASKQSDEIIDLGDTRTSQALNGKAVSLIYPNISEGYTMAPGVGSYLGKKYKGLIPVAGINKDVIKGELPDLQKNLGDLLVREANQFGQVLGGKNFLKSPKDLPNYGAAEGAVGVAFEGGLITLLKEGLQKTSQNAGIDFRQERITPRLRNLFHGAPGMYDAKSSPGATNEVMQKLLNEVKPGAVKQVRSGPKFGEVQALRAKAIQSINADGLNLRRGAQLEKEIEKRMAALQSSGAADGFIPTFAANPIMAGRNKFQAQWIKDFVKKNGLPQEALRDPAIVSKLGAIFAKKYPNQQGMFAMAGGFVPNFAPNISAIEELVKRGATPGERSAAQAALSRIQSNALLKLGPPEKLGKFKSLLYGSNSNAGFNLDAIRIGDLKYKPLVENAKLLGLSTKDLEMLSKNPVAIKELRNYGQSFKKRSEFFAGGFIPNFADSEILEQIQSKSSFNYKEIKNKPGIEKRINSLYQQYPDLQYLGSGAESHAFKSGNRVLKLPTLDYKTAKQQKAKAKEIGSIDWATATRQLKKAEPNLQLMPIRRVSGSSLVTSQRFAGNTFKDEINDYDVENSLMNLVESKFERAKASVSEKPNWLRALGLDTGSSANFTFMRSLPKEVQIQAREGQIPPESLITSNKVGLIDPVIYGFMSERLWSEAKAKTGRSLASGFIPNFAASNDYTKSVLALEESVSGKKAILDSKPFLHIRNKSQPSFASAMRDHGGKNKAMKDSAEMQKGAGLIASSGFIPNFAPIGNEENRFSSGATDFAAITASLSGLLFSLAFFGGQLDEGAKELGDLKKELKKTGRTLDQTFESNQKRINNQNKVLQRLDVEENAARRDVSMYNPKTGAWTETGMAAQTERDKKRERLQEAQSRSETRAAVIERSRERQKLSSTERFNEFSRNKGLGLGFALQTAGGIGSQLAGGDQTFAGAGFTALGNIGGFAATGAAIGGGLPGAVVGGIVGAALSAKPVIDAAALSINGLADASKRVQQATENAQKAQESTQGFLVAREKLGTLTESGASVKDISKAEKEYTRQLSKLPPAIQNQISSTNDIAKQQEILAKYIEDQTRKADIESLSTDIGKEFVTSWTNIGKEQSKKIADSILSTFNYAGGEDVDTKGRIDMLNKAIPSVENLKSFDAVRIGPEFDNILNMLKEGGVGTAEELEKLKEAFKTATPKELRALSEDLSKNLKKRLEENENTFRLEEAAKKNISQLPQVVQDYINSFKKNKNSFDNSAKLIGNLNKILKIDIPKFNLGLATQTDAAVMQYRTPSFEEEVAIGARRINQQSDIEFLEASKAAADSLKQEFLPKLQDNISQSNFGTNQNRGEVVDLQNIFEQITKAVTIEDIQKIDLSKLPETLKEAYGKSIEGANFELKQALQGIDFNNITQQVQAAFNIATKRFNERIQKMQGYAGGISGLMGFDPTEMQGEQLRRAYRMGEIGPLKYNREMAKFEREQTLRQLEAVEALGLPENAKAPIRNQLIAKLQGQSDEYLDAIGLSNLKGLGRLNVVDMVKQQYGGMRPNDKFANPFNQAAEDLVKSIGYLGIDIQKYSQQSLSGLQKEADNAAEKLLNLANCAQQLTSVICPMTSGGAFGMQSGAGAATAGGTAGGNPPITSTAAANAIKAALGRGGASGAGGGLSYNIISKPTKATTASGASGAVAVPAGGQVTPVMTQLSDEAKQLRDAILKFNQEGVVPTDYKAKPQEIFAKGPVSEEQKQQRQEILDLFKKIISVPEQKRSGEEPKLLPATFQESLDSLLQTGRVTPSQQSVLLPELERLFAEGGSNGPAMVAELLKKVPALGQNAMPYFGIGGSAKEQGYMGEPAEMWMGNNTKDFLTVLRTLAYPQSPIASSKEKYGIMNEAVGMDPNKGIVATTKKPNTEALKMLDILNQNKDLTVTSEEMVPFSQTIQELGQMLKGPQKPLPNTPIKREKYIPPDEYERKMEEEQKRWSEEQQRNTPLSQAAQTFMRPNKLAPFELAPNDVLDNYRNQQLQNTLKQGLPANIYDTLPQSMLPTPQLLPQAQPVISPFNNRGVNPLVNQFAEPEVRPPLLPIGAPQTPAYQPQSPLLNPAFPQFPKPALPPPQMFPQPGGGMGYYDPNFNPEKSQPLQVPLQAPAPLQAPPQAPKPEQPTENMQGLIAGLNANAAALESNTSAVHENTNERDPKQGEPSPQAPNDNQQPAPVNQEISFPVDLATDFSIDVSLAEEAVAQVNTKILEVQDQLRSELQSAIDSVNRSIAQLQTKNGQTA